MNPAWIQGLAILSLSAILHGCATSENQLEDELINSDKRPQATLSLAKTTTCCQSFNQITFQPLNSGKIIIDGSNPVMQFAGRKSFFYAATISDSQRSKVLTVQALIGKTAFPVQLQMLNDTYQPTRALSFSEFELTDARLLSDPSLQTQIALLPEERYIIIYADTAQLDKTINIPHPEKLKEKSTGVTALSYPDLQIPFSPWGLIDLQIGEQQNQLKTVLTSDTPIFDTSSKKPAVSTTPSTSYVVTSTTNETQTNISEQTKQYYKQAIQQAVTDNRLEQAMQQVSEGKKLGIADVEQTFINAVKQK